MRTNDLTLHRSAAIIRMPGSGGCGWHTDYAASPSQPQSANDVLNAHEYPNGKWFYLTGSRPEHGGLAVIADSHRPGWPGPEGYALSPDLKTFSPMTDAAKARDAMDVPNMVPVVADPGDMILFAARTYHAAFPNRSAKPRLSCGIGFRPRANALEVPWVATESARKLVECVPARYKAYVEDYKGVDCNWKPPSGK